MKGGKNNMKGGTMVNYTGGAAPADDGCGGWRETVRTKTDIIAFFIIAATPSLTRAANDWIRTTEYGANYDLTLGALGEMFETLDLQQQITQCVVCVDFYILKSEMYTWTWSDAGFI